MKMNKLAAAMGFGLVLVSGAAMADAGSGTVTFTGSIIDAPCSIAPESVDQTVNLGQVSAASLAGQKQSSPKPFYIKLENCDTSTLKTVTTTFSGKGADGDVTLLGIVGTAKGAGIGITDGNSKKIDLGKANDAQTLVDGNNTLNFAAYLQGTSATEAATPGAFTSVSNFTLAYQ